MSRRTLLRAAIGGAGAVTVASILAACGAPPGASNAPASTARRARWRCPTRGHGSPGNQLRRERRHAQDRPSVRVLGPLRGLRAGHGQFVEPVHRSAQRPGRRAEGHGRPGGRGGDTPGRAAQGAQAGRAGPRQRAHGHRQQRQCAGRARPAGRVEDADHHHQRGRGRHHRRQAQPIHLPRLVQ